MLSVEVEIKDIKINNSITNFLLAFLGERITKMAYRRTTNRDNFSSSSEQLSQTDIDDIIRKLQVKVKKATNVHSDENGGTFPMKSSPRGLAVIINNEDYPEREYKRYGSNVDVQNLKDLCEQLDFKVQIYNDLGARKTENILDDVVQEPLIQSTDMLMVFIMSHGKEGHIICSDGSYLATEEILSIFNCKELKDKPKFIVFEASRGEDKDVGVDLKDEMDSKRKGQNQTQTKGRVYYLRKANKDPKWQNMLIAYSTVPGYDTYIDPWSGSLFIKSLVKVFMNGACKKELKFLLQDVQVALNEIPPEEAYFQSIEVSSRGFNKSLYFNPGLNIKDNSEKYTKVIGEKRTHKLETEVRYPNLTHTDHEKNIHTPALTNTDHNWDTSVRTPDTDYNIKKNILTPGLANTNYNLENDRYKLQKIETGSSARCLQYDDQKIVAGLDNGEIKIYNKVTLKLEHIIRAHSNSVNCLQFNKNILLSGSDDDTVKIFSNINYQLLNTLELDNLVMCLKCDLKDMLVTGTEQLSVWKMNSPTDIVKTKVLHSGEYFYNCVDFNETHILNGCNNNIQVWSTRSLELVKTMTGHTGNVRSLEMYKQTVVSGSRDTTVRIWNIQTGSCIRVLEGHTGYVICVRFDTQRIISTSRDETIRIWKYTEALDPNFASDALCIRTLKEHKHWVRCLQFDDTQIVSGSYDWTIRIWNFQSTE